MPEFDEARRAIKAARRARDSADEAHRAANSAVKLAERAALADLRSASRRRRAPPPLPAGLKRAATEARRALRLAETNLARATREFRARSDPRRELGGLPDSDPFLLMPVRLETRFKDQALLVRIYPDSLLVDTFEERLTQSELANTKLYWIALWRADGRMKLRRAAWSALVTSHGAGRARWIIRTYVPINAAQMPAFDDGRVALIVPTQVPLPAAEVPDVSEYFAAVWRGRGDAQKLAAARAVLDGKLGAARAAAIVANYWPVNLAEEPSSMAPPRVLFLVFPSDPPLREAAWNTAPRADPMPDRFVLILDGVTGRREILGEPVRIPLYTGFDPSGIAGGMPARDGATIEFPDETRWLADFDEAVKAGMGFRVALNADEAAAGFSRVYAIGLSLADDAEGGRKRLNRFVEHRLFASAGFEIVPQGTPTNNTEERDSGFSLVDDSDRVFDALAGEGLFTEIDQPSQKRDGQWLAEALGLDMELAKRILNADGRDQMTARAMNTALWPATIGYYMTSLLAPIFERKAVAETRHHFVNHVSGRGGVPAIRIGRQPYGILPVTAFNRADWLLADSQHPRADPYLARLKRLLDHMEARITKFAAKVAHIGGPGNPQETLVDVLGLHPASVEFHYRYGQSAALAGSLLKIARVDITRLEAVMALKARIQGLLRAFGFDRDDSPRIANILWQRGQGILDGGVVCSEPRRPGFETEHRDYLGWLFEAARKSVELLRTQESFPGGEPPRALLYIMLRHALLLAYGDAAAAAHLRLPGFDEAMLADMLREEPLPHVRRLRPQALVSESRWEALFKTEPGISEGEQISVADYLATRLGAIEETGDLAEQLNALSFLTEATREDAERAFAEHIDLCAYRLDAWQLSLPRVQLERMERKGIYLGCYGWLENVRPNSRALTPENRPEREAKLLDPEGTLPALMRDQANGGLIQAPSLNQAVTAAILRNAYMSAGSAAERDAIGVNLSSVRVRDALNLADGMRMGQRLNALLGYRFERGLHERFAEAETDQFLLALRTALPLDAGRLTDTKAQAGEEGKVEARNVVDGLKLVEQMRKTSIRTFPFGLAIAANPPPAARLVIESEAAKLEHLHDGLGDLVLAEAVHQSVQGNFDRVAASLDAFSKSEAPPEPDVVRTPSTGISLAHRVAIHLDPTPAAGTTPRAAVEPALDAWLAAALPELAKIGCMVGWTDPSDGVAHEAPVTLADIGFAALDLVHAWQTEERDNFGELDDLVAEFAIAGHAATLRTDATLDIRYKEAPAAGSFSLFETAALIRPLAAIASTARPLRPGDLMLESDAALDIENAVDFDPAGLAAGHSGLELLIDDMADFVDTAEAAQADAETDHQAAIDAVDALIAEACALARRCLAFGLPQSRPGRFRDAARRVFLGLVRSATTLADDWQSRLARCETILLELPGADDEATIAILRRAETELPLAIISGAEGAAALEAAVRAARDAFANRLAGYRALIATHARGIASFVANYETLLADPQFTTTVSLADSRAEVGGFVAEMAAGIAAVADLAGKRAAAAAAKLGSATGATGQAKVDHLVAAAKALFGEGFRIVPHFTLTGAALAEVENALAAAASGETFKYLRDTLKVPFPLDEWLYGVARVREPMRHLETATLLAEGFGRSAPLLDPLQFPYKPGDSWLGLNFPKDYDIDRGRLLYTAHVSAPLAAGTLRGLLVDEWTEVVPGLRRETGVEEANVHTQTTGVSFHFDRPNAEAPQALLLVTPASWDGAWNWPDVVGALDAAFDLMKRRAVEPARIEDASLSQLLPATVAATAVRDVTISAVLAANIHVDKFIRG